MKHFFTNINPTMINPALEKIPIVPKLGKQKDQKLESCAINEPISIIIIHVIVIIIINITCINDDLILIIPFPLFKWEPNF